MVSIGMAANQPWNHTTSTQSLPSSETPSASRWMKSMRQDSDSTSDRSSSRGSPSRNIQELKRMCRKEAKKLYPNMKRIDSGGTATVYLGKKEGEGLVAIKCILLYSSISPNIKLSGEIRTMKDYPHPNIVIYIDSFIYASKGVEELWLVMEYMAGGNLHDLASYAIARKSPIWTEGIMAAVLKSILSGIEHLHKNSIIHRDIKGANVLLNAAAQIKLADFGFVAPLTLDEGGKRSGSVGTLSFMAPEMFDDRDYAAGIDIWASGIVAIEMRDGAVPHFNTTMRGKIPGSKHHHALSEDFKGYLKACLVLDAKKRPTATKLLQHKFFEHAQNLEALVPLIQEARTPKIKTSISKPDTPQSPIFDLKSAKSSAFGSNNSQPSLSDSK